MNELHLFAGAGGGILGGYLLGHRCVCAVEIEEYPRKVLIQRQLDGILPKFPIWDDITTFDGKPWRGVVDVVCGGFPCQDISCAGKGAGIEGERSGLWGEMARVIDEIRPQYAFVENSPMLTSRGLGRVLGDLAEMGYNARWGVLGGGHLRFPTKRDRIWILGWNNKVNVNGIREILKRTNIKKYLRRTKPSCNISDVETSWLVSNGYAIREFNGMGGELDQIEAIGNGQIPRVAELAWRILNGEK